MTRDLEIEQAILRLDPEGFARFAVSVLQRDGYPLFHVNTVSGKLRSRKGVPDALSRHPDGTYTFLQCTAQENNLANKLTQDLEDCFTKRPKDIPRTAIREVALAFSERLTPELIASLHARAKKLRTTLALVDLDRIKRIVLEKGDDIAEEYLDLKLSTQVLSREAFIKRAARVGVVGDQTTVFRFREAEVDQAIRTIGREGILLITGNAGVGKTRTALEVMDRLQQADPTLRTHYVRNEGTPFVDELLKRCSAPGNYLVLLDDAQRMGELHRMQELLAQVRSDRQIRIVFTVRKIALLPVLAALALPTTSPVLSLVPFTDDQLRIFLDKQYGLQRDHFVDRILFMAKGNPRIAAMVASVIREVGDYSGFRKVEQAFRLYYKEHMGRIGASADGDRLKVLFFFAFFRHIEGAPYQPRVLPALLPILGMSKEQFWAHAIELDRLELIDLLGVEGPGLIADETFGTFLVHRVLFDTHQLDLGKLLIAFFVGYREQVVAAINGVMSVFNTEADLTVLKQAVNEALHHFEGAGAQDVLVELHEVFHEVDATRTLLFVKDLIRSLPPEEEGTGFTFDDERNVHSMDDPLVILRGFGVGDPKAVRTMVVDLMLAFLDRRPSRGGQVVKALVSSFDLHEMGEIRGYRDQFDAAEQIIRKSNKGCLGARGLFYGLARNYLAAQSWRIAPTRKRNEVSSRIHVPQLGEGMRALRTLVWGHLFALYAIENERVRVIQAIRDHLAAFDPRGDKTLLSFDAALIGTFVKESLDPRNNDHCKLVRELVQHWELHGLTYDGTLTEQFTNPSFALMQLLRYDRSLADREENNDEPFDAWRHRMMFIGEGSSPVELERMRILAERFIPEDPTALDPLGPSKAITCVLVGALSQADDLVQLVERQAAKGDPLRLDPDELVPVLMKKIGSVRLEALIAKGGLNDPWSWWSCFYKVMAASDSHLQHTAAFEERLLQAARDGRYLGLRLIRHYRSQCPDLLVNVVRIFVQKLDQRGGRSHVISQLFDVKRSAFEDILLLFRGEEQLLQRAYYWVVVEHLSPGRSGTIFLGLQEQDSSFLARWVAWRYGNLPFTPEPERFSAWPIWQRPEVLEALDAAYEVARKAPKIILGCDNYLFFLFQPVHDEDLPVAVVEAQDAWLRERLMRDHGSQRACEVLLGIVHALPMPRRLEHLLHFIAQQPDILIFRRTALESRISRVSIRNDSTPVDHLTFLRELRDRCVDLVQLNYRAAIEQDIAGKEQEMEAAKVEAIIEERS